jgi:hydroxymethylglutaryl-CoA synthase
MRGVLAVGAYVPVHRLARDEAARWFGGEVSSGAAGVVRGRLPTRAVASFDEDTTTMGVEAARAALAPDARRFVEELWFATPTPTYVDRTNAVTLHAALALLAEVLATDVGGSLRSGMAALLAAANGSRRTLVVAADCRDGLPGSPDEVQGGDAAAAVLLGEELPTLPALAVIEGTGSVTEEVGDRWRVPGERRSRAWEERFGEQRYVELGSRAFELALRDARIGPSALDALVVTGMHLRATERLGRRLRVALEPSHVAVHEHVGRPGTADPLLAIVAALEGSQPGRRFAFVHLADGADAIVLRATDAVRDFEPRRAIGLQLGAGRPVAYGRFLAWRGMVTPEPPRRPEPARVSAPAAWRARRWKYAFVGALDQHDGRTYLPPARMSRATGRLDGAVPWPAADELGTVATYTVDRLAWSESPPVVFAVVDFPGGARLPMELADVSPDEVRIGSLVEPTFRRFWSAEGLCNYFWKARLVASDTGARRTDAAGASTEDRAAGSVARSQGGRARPGPARASAARAQRAAAAAAGSTMKRAR